MLETIGYNKLGSAVYEEDETIEEDIIGLDYRPIYCTKTLHKLLTFYVHIDDIEIARDAESEIEMYVELLRYLDSDGFLV